MALENQASSDRAGYRIPVQITESGHVDLARVRWFTSSEVGAAISLKSIWRGRDRCRLWLWPQAALRQCPRMAIFAPRLTHVAPVVTLPVANLTVPFGMIPSPNTCSGSVVPPQWLFRVWQRCVRDFADADALCPGGRANRDISGI